jgi:hypothetical protein
MVANRNEILFHEKQHIHLREILLLYRDGRGACKVLSEVGAAESKLRVQKQI